MRLKAWRFASVWIEDRAGLAANLRVVGRLEAAQPVVVDADVAEQVRGELLVRVEALALLDEADAVEIQRGDALGAWSGDTCRRT